MRKKLEIWLLLLLLLPLEELRAGTGRASDGLLSFLLLLGFLLLLFGLIHLIEGLISGIRHFLNGIGIEDLF